MNCPKCGAENSIRYMEEVIYEHTYNINKSGKISKNYRKVPISDSQFECCYCTECRKEFNFDIIDGKIVLEV